MDLLSTTALFSQFLNERRYLQNVTASTIEWYETAFKALQKSHGPEPYIKAPNAFCRWLHEEGHHQVARSFDVGGLHTVLDDSFHPAVEPRQA